MNGAATEIEDFQVVAEAREAAINQAVTLIPPGMRQWFEDEMHGLKRVGGVVVASPLANP